MGLKKSSITFFLLIIGMVVWGQTETVQYDVHRNIITLEQLSELDLSQTLIKRSPWFYVQERDLDENGQRIILDTVKIDASEPLGYRGDYWRFRIHFNKVTKQAGNANQYLIEGITLFRDTVRSLKGFLMLDSVKHNLYDVGDYDAEVEAVGTIFGHYLLAETDTSIPNSGKYSGKATFNFIQQGGEILYDDNLFLSDGFCNNMYEGVFESYDGLVREKCNWGDYRIPDSDSLDYGAAEFWPNRKDHGWELWALAEYGRASDLMETLWYADDHWYVKYVPNDYSSDHYFTSGYDYHFSDSCYHAVAEKVSRKAWGKAFDHRTNYNYYRDTTDYKLNASTRSAVFHAMSDAGKEAFAVWNDLVLANTGFFAETDEAIVDIWYANDMEVVFLKNGIMDSCIIAGSDYGVYGKNRIYVGCEGFDCDNHVHLYFYRIADEPHHHTQFLCSYVNPASFEMFGEGQEDWYRINREQGGAMMWYKDDLYFRAWDGKEVVYYRVRLVKK